MRVLLDTNIVLDFVLARKPFFLEANKLFTKLENNDFEAYVSPVTPINVFYTIRRERDRATAFIAISELLKLVQISKSDNSIYQNAFSINFNDYEDAVQHECAVAENLDAIVTRNAKDFKNSFVKVYSPAEFLRFLQTV